MDGVPIDSTVLPWVADGEYSTSLSRVVVQDGTEFLLGSVVDSHKQLLRAAEGMSDHQRQIADNMFYSRIAAFIGNGHSRNVEAVNNAVTESPIYAMRNNGGQRVYFVMTNLALDSSKPDQTSSVVLRVAVCDKNRQAVALKLLTSNSAGSRRKLHSKED